jgi:hypothetical protein
MKAQVISVVAGLALIAVPAPSYAHCDTMDGPVVKAAQLALARADITPVLKWVKPQYEQEIRTAFGRTLAVRQLNADARELADRYLFETLVRLHRAGEGAPYTGLAPAGAAEPVVAASDKALETGSVDALVQEVSHRVADGIRTRFAEALARRKNSDQNVASGREFVRAYVEFIHYVERLHTDAAGGVDLHGQTHDQKEGH